ncbi:MAG: anthranilate synthase component I family protein [Daejeonella sp.]
MQSAAIFHTNDVLTFKTKALYQANFFDTCCYFDSNNYADPYSAFDVMIAIGVKKELCAKTGNAFEELQHFLDDDLKYVCGYFSYDLKNQLERLDSKNPDYLHFPDLYFFIPEHLILIKGNEVKIYSDSAQDIWDSINNVVLPHKQGCIFNGEIKSRFSRADYMHTMKQIKEHILRGDIYELNFCQEFFSENTSLNPVEAFLELNSISPTPFASFFKNDQHYIISATPERFLAKRGNKLISQPIKGTSARSENPVEDENLKEQLKNNEKERSENVMIVDLVRNDLTKSAKPGTVTVEELFGIYSFKQVHHMISTIVCEASEKLSNTQIIKNTFPMGSMTGAPKIRAMQLAEQYERSKRGVYSGAIGYFSPGGDFDFNVVIRTLLYNSASKYLSFQVGSAITYEANPEQEYEECLLKAKAIQEVLSAHTEP